MRVRISSVPVLFYFWRCCVISNREHQINEEIRDKELRVIDVDGNQLGILSADEALKIAFEKDLDLVKIAPQATPPVCRIMDYGKFCFEQTKRAKEAKKNQKVIEIKEVRMSSTIIHSSVKNFLQNSKTLSLKPALLTSHQKWRDAVLLCSFLRK